MDTEWSGASLLSGAQDAVAWERAGKEIEANRCGDLIVRVLDAHGQPLHGIPVRYEQRTHSFRFGAHYPYHAATYDLLQAAGINAATLWLGWKHVQPEPGLFNWTYLERVWNPAALSQRGLRLTAHALNWFKPEWSVMPAYLAATAPADLPRLAYEHVAAIARRWAPYIETYELVNEPFWVDAHAIPMEINDMVRLCHATALAVRDVSPQARLEINFAEFARTPSYHVRPCDFIEAMNQADIPYDSIGLQAFDNGYSISEPPVFYRTKTLAGMIQALRQYSTKGKTLHVSALAAPSGPPPIKAPRQFKLRYGDWSEETQARYLDAAYTLLFAQREVEGITWWCPVDGRLSYIAEGGLLRADLTPKPSYEALRQFIARHTSQGQKYTDVEGRAVIRGYAGEYEITIGAGAVGKPIRHTIEARVVTDRTIVLAHNS